MSQKRDARVVAGWLRSYGETGQLPEEAGSYADLFADDIVWSVMGHGLGYTRDYVGKEQVFMEYMAKIQAKLDPAATVIKQVGVYVDDDQQMITMHNSENLVFKDGQTIAVDGAFLMAVRDGYISRVSEFLDLRPVEAVFGHDL